MHNVNPWVSVGKSLDSNKGRLSRYVAGLALHWHELLVAVKGNAIGDTEKISLQPQALCKSYKIEDKSRVC